MLSLTQVYMLTPVINAHAFIIFDLACVETCTVFGSQTTARSPARIASLDGVLHTRRNHISP